MKRILFTLLACLTMMAAWYGCSKEEDDTEKSGSIYGIVTVSGEPLKGIGVSLLIYEGYDAYKDAYYGSLLLKTVTFDDGHYEFTDLTPGEYVIVVEGEAYEKFNTRVAVESGRQARVDMQLSLAKTGLNVVTHDAELAGNSVLLKGEYTYAGSYYPTEYGFYYSSSMHVSSGTKVISSDNARIKYSTFAFSASISNLSPGKYYVQSYAKNSKGITYGDIKTFYVF